MLSITNLLCGQQAGNERLRYGHTGAAGSLADGRAGVPRPVVVWALTRACNLHCVHCYASATAVPDTGELTRREGLDLLDDLRGFGVPAVLLSGGEPLTRPEALDFIAHAQSIGLATTLSTNGLLIDDAMADRLAESGLRYVGISLDGIASRHDQLRGQKGAFAASLAAIDRCRSRGIKVGARFTVHGLNWQDLDAIFEICLEHNVQRL
ncbi:MAG: radical SAM protein, partial [Phycisphaerae bacterium]|nr:radical SAM protein [Phycisphaerae bacterium]